VHYASVHCYWRLQCNFIWFLCNFQKKNVAVLKGTGLFQRALSFPAGSTITLFSQVHNLHNLLRFSMRPFSIQGKQATPIQRNIKSNATSRLSRIFAKYIFNHKVDYALLSVLCRSRLEPTGQEMSYRIRGMLSMSMLSTMA
jgi:hypothetical protein